MTGQFEYLDIDDLVALATMLFGDPPPIADLGLLGSAAARPSASLLGRDAYPDVESKAAALLQSIVNNHALVDGNKRLGWLATATFLEINGVHASALANDDVFELVMWIASANPVVEEIREELRRLLGAVQPSRD